MSRKTNVTAKAKCMGFDIEIKASLTSKDKTLTSNEMREVKRMVKHQLTTSISKLPFSEIYPFEVVVR